MSHSPDPWVIIPAGLRHHQFGEVHRCAPLSGRKLPSWRALLPDGRVLGVFPSVRRAKTNLMLAYHGLAVAS